MIDGGPMRSLANILLTLTLGLFLCFCSSTPETEETQNYPQYENYSSSGVYNDIQKEGADARNVSSEDYSDDDYGADDDEDEDIYLSDGDNNEKDSEEALSAYAEPADDPLPVEKIETVKKKKVSTKKKVSGKFKNGMYRMSVNCNMRQKPDAQSKAVGKVKKGKKLWVEGHNANWVKVYKKSGPVYINKLCL
jgi:hypothetical protein